MFFLTGINECEYLINKNMVSRFSMDSFLPIYKKFQENRRHFVDWNYSDLLFNLKLTGALPQLSSSENDQETNRNMNLVFIKQFYPHIKHYNLNRIQATFYKLCEGILDKIILPWLEANKIFLNSIAL